jgi:hypothetical protein
MRLFTTITSERGKPVTKSGNEYISISVTNSYKQYATLEIDAMNGDIELRNGNGDIIYQADAVTFSKD